MRPCTRKMPSCSNPVIYFRQDKSNDFVFHMNYLWQKKAHIFLFSSTDGADKNGTLVFIHFSAQAASISIISVAIMQRRSWGFQNTPNLQSLHKIWLIKQPKTKWLTHCFSKSNIKPILENFNFLPIAITWLKIIQIWQVGGVPESSGTPLTDGHRDFEDWCILGWVIHEKQVSKS